MKRERKPWSHLAVQCVLCGVILLTAVLFRLIGGTAWETMRAAIHAWMYQ